ncbi:hypothetical protein IFM89_006162 [Coptis chinensis]|uniref:CCDC22 coiled-coil domain-containing protein n=1 Tax=Coptis chinensis TaxID=261450 RepID=A0A835GZB2_9MAGN|nr:hypothetical protein IFM89_006162 [Coptis chinensis]
METTGVSDRECALKHPLSDWSEKAESSASSSLKKLTELPKSETVVEEVSIILLPEGQILNEHNAMHESRSESLESTKEEKTRTVKDVGSGEEESEDTRTHAFGSKEAMSLTRDSYVTTLNEKLVFLQAQSSKKLPPFSPWHVGRAEAEVASSSLGLTYVPKIAPLQELSFLSSVSVSIWIVFYEGKVLKYVLGLKPQGVPYAFWGFFTWRRKNSQIFYIYTVRLQPQWCELCALRLGVSLPEAESLKDLMHFLKHWICPPIGFRLIQMSKEIKDLRSQGEMLKQELAGSALESHHLEIEHGLLKATMEMAINDQHPADFHIRELNKQLKPGSLNVLEQELDWHAFRKPPLGEKERSTKELHHLLNPEMQSNLQTLNEVELETEAIILEIRKREEEHSKLFGELEKQPRAATRKSYIQRVTEITKNSRKQDAGIEQILKDTRDLRLESNSIQERLHRTYVLADETMSRDVKKDLVRQQVYRLLTTIHESFGQIFEKISITDRIRREVVEQEAKLAAVSTSSLNIEKLQADLDKIRKENKLLEAAP